MNFKTFLGVRSAQGRPAIALNFLITNVFIINNNKKKLGRCKVSKTDSITLMPSASFSS